MHRGDLDLHAAGVTSMLPIAWLTARDAQGEGSGQEKIHLLCWLALFIQSVLVYGVFVTTSNNHDQHCRFSYKQQQL